MPLPVDGAARSSLTRTPPSLAPHTPDNASTTRRRPADTRRPRRTSSPSSENGAGRGGPGRAAPTGARTLAPTASEERGDLCHLPAARPHDVEIASNECRPGRWYSWQRSARSLWQVDAPTLGRSLPDAAQEPSPATVLAPSRRPLRTRRRRPIRRRQDSARCAENRSRDSGHWRKRRAPSRTCTPSPRRLHRFSRPSRRWPLPRAFIRMTAWR